MAEKSTSPSESFDLDKLKELIEMMEKHGLTEVHLRHGAEQWRLRRGGQDVIQSVLAPVAAPSAPAIAAVTPQAPAASESAADIRSPIVGTFYTAATPEDPAFVQVGQTVTPDTVVCIVEAMKVFNQITADVNGTIEEVLVNNGDPVESGQRLFRVKPS